MPSRILFATVIAFALAACGSQPKPDFSHYVDEGTGESFTLSREPIRMVAAQPALSRVGKDYLYVAPVRLSGRAAPQNYLWFGIGSSTDRPIMGTKRPEVTSVVLLIDEIPMTFDIVPWRTLAASEPFEVGVEHYESYGARVTLSQLRKISAAAALGGFVIDAKERSPRFEATAGSASHWPDL